MQCNLEEIVKRLSQLFPVQVDGPCFQAITDMCPLSSAQSSRKDTLYLSSSSALLQYSGQPLAGPVLCITAGAEHGGYRRELFPTVIWVTSSQFSEVYLALGKILYAAGTQASPLAEAAAEFLRCKSFEALIDAGFAHLGNPFAVFDDEGNVLAYTQKAAQRDENLSSTAFLHSVHSATHWDIQAFATQEKAREAGLPMLVEPRDSSFPAMIQQPIDSRGKNLGVLIVLAMFRPFAPEDCDIVQVLSRFLALDLIRQTSIHQSYQSDAGALRRYLETGEVENPEVGSWIHRQLEKANPYQYILLINGNSSVARKFWNAERILGDLAGLMPGATCTRMEAGIVLYFTTGQEITRLSPILAPLEEYLQRNQLVAGLSHCFSDVTRSRKAFREAVSAIDYGNRLEPERTLHAFADNALWHALGLLQTQMDLRDLLFPGLESFLQDQNEDYFKTLETYVLTGCRKSATAAQLFVHLNTVKYRLAQISQRLAVDLSDPEVVFRLSLSLRIWRFLNQA